MRQILKKSAIFYHNLKPNNLNAKKLIYSFSAMPPNMEIQKAVEFQFKFRSILKLSELNDYLLENKQDIKKYGKTIILQFLNEYPMQSFRRSRDEFDLLKKEQKYKMRQKIYMFLIELEDLNFYELNMRYSIFNKLITYVGPQPSIIQEIKNTEQKLVAQLRKGDIHISDLMNWLYMLPLNYKPEHSCLAFDILEVRFKDPEVREFLKSQRSLPALIKSTFKFMSKESSNYNGLDYFLCFQASIRQVESIQELVMQLERIAVMKLHLVGEKVIPKMVDQIMDKFDKQFQTLTRNKISLLRVFSVFKYLPLNYNVQFFNKIHNALKSSKQLPSHLLIYLPYRKLTQSQISFLQSKMFADGRQDVASKLIYTIYQPWFRDSLTPFIIKQAYSNLFQMWKKDNGKTTSDYQFYLSIIFRFMKLKDSSINPSKLKNIFYKIAKKIEEQNYEIFNSFSVPAMIAFLQVCHHFDISFNERILTNKIENTLKMRKQKNSTSIHVNNLLSAIKVHQNASHQRSRYFLTQFIQQIGNNPEVEQFQKLQLLFLIQKSLNFEEKWSEVSKKLTQQFSSDIECFVQTYIKYDQKTLKLTNFIFTVLHQHKVDFSIIAQLLSSLNIKLITSLKGKLISPVKKYINETDPSKFDFSNVKITSLLNTYRQLFYFKNQIPQFMEYFSIKLIQLIQKQIKDGKYINGNQFASLCNYLMETISNIQIKKKTQIIESIVSILKTLRKKQGLYLKVFELDFLCNHQKYIKINKEVLDHHWNQIVSSLKKTDRIQHHKELMLILIKLHCREFASLSAFDLRYFTQKCTQMIQVSALTLPKIKQCLGYEILECQDASVIDKMKVYLSGLVKLAFRKLKRKQNYFMYEYYLRFFSKIQQKEMISEICDKLLFEKLYPAQISNIVPILSKNQIKNRKFIKRILQVLTLSDSYVTFEKMQVLSWLEKICYDFSKNDFNLNKIRNKIDEEILQKTSALKLQMKNQLQQQNRSVETGFQVNDPDFDKNYKIFIDYAWASLKNKKVHTPQFKFICRYIFFNLDKIKKRIQKPEQSKQISKIKLYHLIKFIKQMGFFNVNETIVEKDIRENNIRKEKAKKLRILEKMIKDLNFMKIEPCQKLQKKLFEFSNLITFKHQYTFQSLKNKTIEYYIGQKSQGEKKLEFNYAILTVKNYHRSPCNQISHEAQTQNQKALAQKSKRQSNGLNPFFHEQEIDVLEKGLEQIQDEPSADEFILKIDDDQKDSQNSESGFTLEEKSQNNIFARKEAKENSKSQKKPLFSMKKKQKEEQSNKIQRVHLKHDTILKLQKYSEDLHKDYNGYLKVQQSLLQLTIGIPCIIFDPQRDIFFN